ncbi:MAG: hypothetical protein D4R41_05900 [Sediminibacterium sp.]|nr:MAG: hypothetical protein D4R41_05900 [Sediminibacterium sp.]
MLGFVAENLPKTGAVGLNFMGGAGMFAVSVYTMFMGGYYDELVNAKLKLPEVANDLNLAKKAAGPEIINVTLIIPMVLAVAFIGLFFYMRGKKNSSAQAA